MVSRLAPDLSPHRFDSKKVVPFVDPVPLAKISFKPKEPTDSLSTQSLEKKDKHAATGFVDWFSTFFGWKKKTEEVSEQVSPTEKSKGTSSRPALDLPETFNAKSLEKALQVARAENDRDDSPESEENTPLRKVTEAELLKMILHSFRAQQELREKGVFAAEQSVHKQLPEIKALRKIILENREEILRLGKRSKTQDAIQKAMGWVNMGAGGVGAVLMIVNAGAIATGGLLSPLALILNGIYGVSSIVGGTNTILKANSKKALGLAEGASVAAEERKKIAEQKLKSAQNALAGTVNRLGDTQAAMARFLEQLAKSGRISWQ